MNPLSARCVTAVWCCFIAVLWAGCTTGPSAGPVATPHLVTAQAPPVGGIWLELEASVEHRSPVGHASRMTRGSWVPVTWVVAEGSSVKPGDELAIHDTEALQTWQNKDVHFLRQQEQIRRLDLLRADGEIAQLRLAIGRLQAQRTVLAAELVTISVIDSDRIRVAELQCQNATVAHAAATQRRDRLERAAAAGAPVAGSELARAREDAATTLAGLAAPQVALALARQPADSAVVARVAFALADLDAQLGSTPEEGLAVDLRTAEERRRRREVEQGNSRNVSRKRNYESRARALQDPAIRATAEGVVQLRDANVRVGRKLNGGLNTIFVLDRAGLAARILVPEALRGLAAVGSEVALLVPGTHVQPLRGVVQSLASAPEHGRDGQPYFPALVALHSVPEGLKPGMEAECRLAVAARGSCAVLPSYCVTDPEHSTITLADGTTRQIQGYRAAGWFVVASGIQPGEQVRVPDRQIRSGSLHLSALVEPAAFTPVALRSAGWEPTEMLPEGSVVTAGMRIARMTNSDGTRLSEEVRADAEVALVQARYDLAVSQLVAAAERAAAQTAALRSSIASGRARLECRAAREAYDAVAQASSTATVAQAEIARDRAARELAATTSERRAGAVSDQQVRAAQVSLARTEARLQQAHLAGAAYELGRDWIAQLKLEDTARNAEEVETAQRSRILLAGESQRAQLAAANARFESARRAAVDNLRRIADEELVAPVAGVLVYGRDGVGPPRLGRILVTNEPFRIAVGNERRATFEVPARYFATINQGDRIRLITPGREEPIVATVHAVAVAFLPPQSLAEEIAIGRTVGPEDRVFKVTVAFSDLPLGSTVSVEL